MDLSKRLIKVLIEMYRERKCLWQVKSDDYRKKNLRMKAYQEIVSYLQSEGITDATDSLVRDRIQNMRRSVRKERGKIEASKGTYKTGLWYYDILDFAIEQNDKPAPTSNARKVSKFEMEDSDTDHSSNVQDQFPDGNIKTENQSQEEAAETASNAKSLTDNTTPEPVVKYVRNPDEFEALGISIAAKVRRMESKQKIHAELLIQKVLAKGLLGELNDNIDLVDLSNVQSLQSHKVVTNVDL